MPAIAPFEGVRYDPERVAIERAWVARHSRFPAERWLAAEPRCALRLSDAPSAALWRAELLRAAVLIREEDPAIYVVRYGAADDAEDERELGFFALLDDEAPPRLSDPGPGPIECAVLDKKRKVRRILRGATEELEPEVSIEREGVVVELFVVEDETTCARLITRMADAEVLQVTGAEPDAEALVFFQPVTSVDAGPITALHPVITGGDRGEILDAARAFFDLEEVDEETARDAVARGEAAALLDAEGGVLLHLLTSAPAEAFDLRGVAPDEAAPDALLAAAIRALCGPPVALRAAAPADVEIGEGERVFLLPPPTSDSDGRRPAGSLALARALPLGVVIR